MPDENSVRLIHTNFGVPLTLPRSYCKKPSQFRDIKTGLCVGRGGVASNPFIVIRILLLEHVEEALAGQHVNSAALRIEEQVITRTGNLAGGDLFSGFRIKGD